MPSTFEPFRTIVADCPWPYGDKLPGKNRGAEKNYNLMNLDDIARYLGSNAMFLDVTRVLGRTIPMNFIAHDARLFLWRVHPMQVEALHVMKAWGFGEPVSELVWAKTSREPFVDVEGVTNVKLAFGMGRTFRLSHEVCLVGRRGRPEVLSKSERSLFFAPVREHSQKPEEFFKIVEKVSPGPYLELFSGGHRRAGWTSLGYAHFGETKTNGESVGA
jgi:N6-adenosine-specific RNA methylase IME4